MADLSDAIGEETKRRMEQLLVALFRKAWRFYKDTRDADYREVRKRLTEINASRPDDPWVAVRLEMGGRWERVPGDGPSGQTLDYVSPREARRRFEEQFREHFGDKVPFEFVNNHIVFPRTSINEVCQWCRDNGWAKEIKPIDSEYGRDVTFVTVGCPDEETALEVFQDLHEEGIYDVGRCADDPTALVVGYGSDDELPDIVSCLARHGIGRDAVRGVSGDQLGDLSERSDRPRETKVPDPPATFADAVCGSEDIMKTLTAACRNEREQAWAKEPPTKAMEARIGQLHEAGRIPDDSMEAYASVRNKLTAHRLLNTYDNVKFNVGRADPHDPPTPEGARQAPEPPSPQDGPDAARGAAGTPEGPKATQDAQEAQATGEKAPTSPDAPEKRGANTPQEGPADSPRDERSREEREPDRAPEGPDDGMGRPDGTEAAAARAQADERARQREYGTKEIYTGDRVVEATTMDRVNPVSSDGQDAVERSDAEDDVSARREQDARREAEELERYDAERGNDYLPEQKADATMASVVDEQARREEISIPDPQR